MIHEHYHDTELLVAHELHQPWDDASFHNNVNAVIVAVWEIGDCPACIRQDVLITEMEQLDQRGKQLKNSYSTLNIFLDYGINLCGTGCQTHTPVRLFNYWAVMSLTCRTADNGGHGFLFRHKLDNVHVRLRRYPTWSDEASWQTGLKQQQDLNLQPTVEVMLRESSSILHESVYFYWESLKMWRQTLCHIICVGL